MAAKTDTANDLAEVKAFMQKAIEQGKEEGYVLEESVSLFPWLSRPQARLQLDGVIAGRTPENPCIFGMDPTPRRRASPHIDRLPAVQQEDAALRSGGRPGRVQRPGPAVEGSEFVVFYKNKRQVLKVRPACAHGGKWFACITHGVKFKTADELAAHCSDTVEHNTTETEFDAPSLGEGHVTAFWCEQFSKEMKPNVLGALEPRWVMHGLEALKKKE